MADTKSEQSFSPILIASNLAEQADATIYTQNPKRKRPGKLRIAVTDTYILLDSAGNPAEGTTIFFRSKTPATHIGWRTRMNPDVWESP